MPIRLEPDFPAKSVLESEDIFAIDNSRAEQQDIRPLKLLILNGSSSNRVGEDKFE